MGKIIQKGDVYYYLHTNKAGKDEELALPTYPTWLAKDLIENINFLDKVVKYPNKQFNFQKTLAKYGYNIYSFIYIPGNKGKEYKIKYYVSETYDVRPNLIEKYKNRICKDFSPINGKVFGTLADCINDDELPEDSKDILFLHRYTIYSFEQFTINNLSYAHIKISRIYHSKSDKPDEILFNWYIAVNEKEEILFLDDERFKITKRDYEHAIEQIPAHLKSFEEFDQKRRAEIINAINNCENDEELENYLRKQTNKFNGAILDVNISNIKTFKIYLTKYCEKVLKEEIKNRVAAKVIIDNYNNYVASELGAWLHCLITKKQAEENKRKKEMCKSYLKTYSLDYIIARTIVDEKNLQNDIFGFVQLILGKSKTIEQSIEYMLEYFPYDKFDLVNGFDRIFEHLRECIVIAYTFLNNTAEHREQILKWEKEHQLDLAWGKDGKSPHFKSGTHDSGINRSNDFKHDSKHIRVRYEIKPTWVGDTNISLELLKNRLIALTDAFNGDTESGSHSATIDSKSIDIKNDYLILEAIVYKDEEAELEGKNKIDARRINYLTKLYNKNYYNKDQVVLRLKVINILNLDE